MSLYFIDVQHKHPSLGLQQITLNTARMDKAEEAVALMQASPHAVHITISADEKDAFTQRVRTRILKKWHRDATSNAWVSMPAHYAWAA